MVEMKQFFKSRVMPALLLCCLPVPGLALNGSLLDSPASTITRQVERNAERIVERAANRQIEKRLEEPAGPLENGLRNLPDVVPVYTREGLKAFNDVLLDDGFRSVERQWLVTGTEAEIQRLNQPGIQVLEQTRLSGLGMIVARFRVDEDIDSFQDLRNLLPDLADRLDRNHVYAPGASGHQLSGEIQASRSDSICEGTVRIGMIDTSVASDHPAFRDAQIVEQRFLSLTEGPGELAPVSTHGTAVAAQLVGRQGSAGTPRLPGATLFNASVFYKRTEEMSAATLTHLLKGLDWLATRNLPVINISLTGPDNRLLATAVKNLREKGILLVAAVGNEGPAVSPLYPAAYPEVIGVTATSRSGELYRWANRGEPVMFAAHGVKVSVPHPGGGWKTDSGTSLAAPIVAAALACGANGGDPDMAVEALINQAQDLGEPGRDHLFGFGLLPY